jgi:HrpA-like RNA helicase
VSILHNPSPRESRIDASVSTAIRIHLHEPEGDILCFLTGFEECEHAVRKTNQTLQELDSQGKQIAPVILVSLYGSQSAEQ